jgi:hypothetical protein
MEFPASSWTSVWRGGRSAKDARRCVITLTSSAAAPLSPFIIPQIAGDNSWMFDRCSGR